MLASASSPHTAMHLLDLPVELLEKILLLVPPRTLISRVSVTCRRLRELLQNELFWRRRYAIQARTPLPLSESWHHWQLGSVQNEFARVLGGGERNMHVSTLAGMLTGRLAWILCTVHVVPIATRPRVKATRSCDM